MADNFNYISFGNVELVDEVTQVSMSRSRMFEYTPTDLANGLEDLGSEAIDFLTTLPTFLCSEVSLVINGAATMHVRFGRIENLRVDHKAVAADFVPIVEFGEITFHGVAYAAEVFRITGFQPYRTHWAVREGEAKTILDALAECKPECAQEVAEFLGAEQDAPDAPPPERKKNIITTIRDVQGVSHSPAEFTAVGNSGKVLSWPR